MILQRLEWEDAREDTEKLYYRKNKDVRKEGKCMILSPLGRLDFMTYFNLFSAEKWRRYTGVREGFFALDMEGAVVVTVWALSVSGERKKIHEETLKNSARQEAVTGPFAFPDSGVIGVELSSGGNVTRIYGGYYGTSRQPVEENEIQIGIAVCTYRREQYVKRNMDYLKERILENDSALSAGHVSVCISDNAGTLKKEEIEREDIRIVKNKNLGGVGGFTRGMIEHMRSGRKITHVLLMDDDAVLSAAAIERTYRLLTILKPEFRDSLIGGSLIQEDLPCILYETGARWNDGEIEAIHHGLDLTRLEDALKNEAEEKTEYAGWWYCCIPVSFIKEKGFPLPLFIHRDDIEYGLRAEGKFIFLNGICVWHEAFENKLPGFLEYYDMRNLAIANAVHDPGYGAKDFKKMLFIQVGSNVGKYRYKYVDLNLKGAADFLRGAEWFLRQDTMELHAGLAKYNYETRDSLEYAGYRGIREEELDPCSRPEEEPPGLLTRVFRIAAMNGHFFPVKTKIRTARPNPNIYELYRCREVIFADSTGKAICVRRSVRELFKAYIKLLKTYRMIDRYYERACASYRKDYELMISERFWKRYLEIE